MIRYMPCYYIVLVDKCRLENKMPLHFFMFFSFFAVLIKNENF